TSYQAALRLPGPPGEPDLEPLLHKPLDSPPPAQLAASRARLRGALAAALGFPWIVHAAAVTASALRAHPLSGRAPAVLILLGASAFAVALYRLAVRSGSGFASPGGDARRLPPVVQRLAHALVAAGGAALGLMLAVAIVLPVVAYDALAYRLPTI